MVAIRLVDWAFFAEATSLQIRQSYRDKSYSICNSERKSFNSYLITLFNLPFKISITLPDKSCPTFGIAPGTGLKLFDEGDLILEELVMLKFSINDLCCNCPRFPAFVPAENMFAENVDLPPISVPNVGVEITEGFDPNIFGLLIVLS